MKYMLMMNAPRGTGDWNINAWIPQEIEATMAFMGRLNEELGREGVLVGLEGLGAPDRARVVSAGSDGKPVVTDGPFPEAKEFLAGYWIVDVETPEQAYAIAARASATPRTAPSSTMTSRLSPGLRSSVVRRPAHGSSPTPVRPDSVDAFIAAGSVRSPLRPMNSSRSDVKLITGSLIHENAT